MEANRLLKPASVASGAGVSIIAPASFARQERLTAGMERMTALGYMPKFADNALARGPLFFAGTQEARIADLNAAFADPETQAVMCLRGGYGSNYLLEDIDLELFRAHPKPFFAYSDLTGLQLHLLDKLHIPAFHGPMLAADFYLEDGVHLPSFHAALAGQPYGVGFAEGLRVLKPGSASGTLYGGCLSILVAMLGTSWEPQTEGKLLFIEDLNEKPYRIDRMLWQLRKAGKFNGVTGIIFGEMLDCVSSPAETDQLDQAIMNALNGFQGPIAIGLRSGHVSRQNVTLTFGVAADLHVSEEIELKLLEPAVKR
jgi:muramoyltetrapeptide carboxypeptidase